MVRSTHLRINLVNEEHRVVQPGVGREPLKICAHRREVNRADGAFIVKGCVLWIEELGKKEIEPLPECAKNEAGEALFHGGDVGELGRRVARQAKRAGCRRVGRVASRCGEGRRRWRRVACGLPEGEILFTADGVMRRGLWRFVALQRLARCT